MKKLVCLILALAVLGGVVYAAAEENKTPFDEVWVGTGSYDIIVKDLWYKADGLSEAFASNDNALDLMAKAWCNLLKYEVETEGKSVNETTAAAIYRNMKKRKICVERVSAQNKDASIVNFFFASATKDTTEIYWIEWNMADEILRCKYFTSYDRHKNADSLLYDSSLMHVSIMAERDPKNFKTDNVVAKSFKGSGKKLFNAFDKAYKEAHDGKKNPIK